MPDRAQLIERYPDLLAPDVDEDLLAMVAALDAAAEPYWHLEVPSSVDVAVSQLWRRQARVDRARTTTIPAADRPAAEGTEPDQPAQIVPFGATRTRRWWLRQGLGIVAAVLVLLVVGGVLAAVLRGGSSGGTTPGSGPNGSGLPLTVTAAGIPITLESVDASSTSTRFTFSVQLPSYAVPVGMDDPVVFFPGDVQATGVTVRPQDPLTTATGHAPGRPTATFSLTYGPVTAPGEGATLTFRQIRLALAPASMKVVPGPWVFHITPAMLKAQAQPLPTPNRFGTYNNLSVAQAQRLVAFPIVEPQPLPSALFRQDNAVTVGAVGPTGSARANWVILDYQATDANEKGVLVEESTNGAIVPIVQNGVLHVLETPGKPAVIQLRGSFQTTVAIQGVNVTRLATVQEEVAGPPQGYPETYFTWQQHGVFYVVSTSAGTQVTDRVVQQFIGAMIAPAGPNATPTDQLPPLPAGLPTPDASGQYRNLTFAQARQLVPFPLVQPSWVPPSLQPDQIYALAATPTARPWKVMLSYGAISPTQHYQVEIDETATPMHVTIGGAATPTTVTIAGHPVSRTVLITPSGVAVLAYQWQSGGTACYVSASLTSALTEQDVEHMIASMLQAAPTATPVAAGVVGVPTIGPVDSNAAGPHAQAAASTRKSSGGTGALWWMLWIALGVGCAVLLAWLAERLGVARHPHDDESMAHHLDEVEARSRFPYL